MAVLPVTNLLAAGAIAVGVTSGFARDRSDVMKEFDATFEEMLKNPKDEAIAVRLVLPRVGGGFEYVAEVPVPRVE